jgi:hypothetical protein
MENNFIVTQCQFHEGSKLVVLDKVTTGPNNRLLFNRVTKKRINELFGPCKFNEGRDGYSKTSIYVAHKEAPDEIYRIYTLSGVFRIGGTNYGPHLGELMELINPVAFAGLSGKSTREHLSRFRSRFEHI